MHVGDYSIGGELGRGAAGVVFRGTAPDGSLVAIKVLSHAGRGDALARFQREKRLLGGFGLDDGFVPLLDTGVLPDGRPWLVMPLVEGGTLRARLDRGRLEIDEAVELGRALARAIGKAHAQGVIHRDVKPENVLFDAAGRPLLADLGLAKHFAGGSDASRVLSKTGEFRGTPIYMSPEQATDAARATPASDVYSLGVLLYECLAGRPPIAGETILEMLAKKSSGSFDPLDSVRKEVPLWLARAIARTLEGKPEDRPADGAAFERTLVPVRGSRKSLVALVVTALVTALVAAVVALGGAGALLAPRPAHEPVKQLGPLEEDLASLAAVGSSDRSLALARLLRSRDPAVGPALDEAIARAPEAPWLRHARLAREKKPRSADVLVALPLLSRDLLDDVLARAVEHGLDGEQALACAVALAERAPGRSDPALLLARARLAAGQRAEALEALRAVRDRRPEALALLTAAREVEAFAGAWEGASIFDTSLGVAGARTGAALERAAGFAHVSSLALGTLVAPITSRLHRIALHPTVEDNLKDSPRTGAVELVFEKVAPRLPDAAFAHYELATIGRRPGLEGAALSMDEVDKSYRDRRTSERLRAAQEALRDRDPLLAIEAGLKALELEMYRAARGGIVDTWLEPWLARLDEVGRIATDASMHHRVALEETRLAWGACVNATPRARPILHARVLAAAERGHALHVGEALARAELARMRVWALLALRRLPDAEAAFTDEVQSPAARAEVLRRKGDNAGAVRVARDALAGAAALPSLEQRYLHATLAIALSAVGDHDGANAELATTVLGWGGGSITLFELDVNQVKALVEQARR